MIPPLDPREYQDTVRRALAEDIGSGDVTTEATVNAGQQATGVFLAKSDCVLAGLDIALQAFTLLDPAVTVRSRRPEGAWCRAGDRVAEIAGPARALIIAERTALNFLQRLSGIATTARRYVDEAGGRITVLDTRKTTPTLRALEKYAVRAGGACNHRSGLYDAILIKDNHIRLAGGVAPAIRLAREGRPGWPIEIEAQTLEQVDQAIDACAETVLLDNLPIEAVREAVRRISGRARVEISGGVTLERLHELSMSGADFVSVGALTHSAPAVDISFELEPL